MFQHRHDPEAERWYNRMAKDDNWEKFRYLDVINNYNSIIEQFREKLKLREKENASKGTDNRILRAELEEAIRDLKKLLAEYNQFKQHKQRSAITE